MKKIMFFIIFLLLLSCEKNGNVDNSENLANSKNISDNNENIKKTNNENIEKINKERSIEEEIKNMVVIWNAASNNADFGTLEKILGDKIVKEVSTRKETKEYPSYLAFENINGSWKLVVESDTVSDANIARMKQRKNNTQEKVQEQQPAIITPNQSQYYYGSSVKLVGTITRRKYQNPDNSVANVFLLRLSTPITVIGNTEDSPTERNVQEIQLMGNETISLFDKDVVGKKVQITGELFHLHTGHHYTQVLILVSNINFLN